MGNISRHTSSFLYPLETAGLHFFSQQKKCKEVSRGKCHKFNIELHLMPHVRQFLIFKVGPIDPFYQVNNKHWFGLFIQGCLQRNYSKIYNASAEKYSASVTLRLDTEQSRENLIHFTPMAEHMINRFLDEQFNEHVFQGVELFSQLPRVQKKDILLSVYSVFQITEEMLPYETLAKRYQRWRNKKNAQTSPSFYQQIVLPKS